MGRFEDVNFEEVLNTTGGPAAIAANLNLFSGYTLTGTDQIDAVRMKGLLLMRIMTQDTDPLATAAFGDITLTSRREGDISLPLMADVSIPGLLDLSPGIVLPPAEGINCLANGSANAGDEHTIVLRIWNPNKDSDFTVRKPPTTGVEMQINEMPTDANTAYTIDNFVDITGRLNAYTNGQTALPDDQRVEVWLKAIRVIGTAVMGGIAVAMPGLNHVYIYPVAPAGNTRIDFESEFGGALYCTADAPVLIAGIGSGAVPQLMVLEMVVKRPGGM